MKKYLLLFLTFAFFFLPKPASAHVLETDGSIGAVLHIDPNDDPVAKEQATFFFAIKDKENKFSFQKCICEIVIKTNDKIIYQEQVAQPSVSFTFPTTGIYEVSLQGKPTTLDAFKSFKLSYDIRVEQATTKNSSQDTTIKNLWNQFGYITIGAIALVIITLRVIYIKK